MSLDASLPTADLRSSAQDSKRHDAHKHKWKLGSVASVGRDPNYPRPSRARETDYSAQRRATKSAVASLAHGLRNARQQDIRECNSSASAALTLSGDEHSSSTSASGSEDDGVAATAVQLPPAAHPSEIMYSFDWPCGPSRGSQIFGRALEQAVERFEEQEMVRLVRREYEVLDSEGESVPVRVAAGGKKGRGRRGKAVAAGSGEVGDDEYEFV